MAQRSGTLLKNVVALLLATALAACGTTGFTKTAGEVDGAASNGNPYSDFLVATYAGSTRDARVASARYMAALQADPTNTMLLERAFIFAVAAGDMKLAAELAPRVMAADPASANTT